ncbi:hypothetical protein AVEN_96180-1 [Araneus ventricosus]|uniref:NADH dehydrogenase [ubiquinone] 1 beta subcomplex subunit 2, mitochondrial n=1 Tax=Araneus ventricosus TaxID=182803 RepID=A0A4Y2FV42_ARAVE|nr:hypothetical protein AVEN_96180-1 [Araneus ventricosus]
MLPRVLRAVTQVSRGKRFIANLEARRHGHANTWVYRQEPVRPDEWRFYVADGLNCFMWWWIFVHLWYQWGHVAGEFDYPEPAKWTDADLGVVDVDLD